jgi:enoyl-CoA hydratase/carnithine racemase
MDTITLVRDGELPGLATLTLNRPEKLNAISGTMHRDIQEACRELGDDASVRVVIVTGAGRAFSAGADLGPRRAAAGTALVTPPAPVPPLEERLRATMGNRTSAALETLPQVTIGAVNGLAVGGAVVFLACLDIRIAAEPAWFSIPEVDLDIPLTWNALPRLMRELGPARTKELVMTCDRFTSEDALRWGFVNHVVPEAELLPLAWELAAKLLAKDPMAVALTKSTCNALAEAMVPAHVTHSDPDYLFLSRLIGTERRSQGSGRP